MNQHLDDDAIQFFEGDFDGDGDLDMVGVTYDRLGWKENDGNGNFYKFHLIDDSLTTPGSGSPLFVGDFNGDSLPDVLLSTYNDGKVRWYANLGNGVFGAPNQLSSSESLARVVYAFDYDGDSDLDIFVGALQFSRINLYQNNGAGGFLAPVAVTTSANGINSIFAADLDGDLDADLLSTSFNDDKVAWYPNLGNGSFGSQQVISTNTNFPASISASDLNGNGNNDVLLVSKNNDKVIWYPNLGGGSFGSEQLISSSVNEPSEVRAVDLDNDLDMDVAYVSSIDRSITWQLNNGSGSFGLPSSVSSAQWYQKLRLVDMDGDGFKDFCSKHWNSIVWLKNSSLAFNESHYVFDQLNSSKSVDYADFNGDGKLDVLATDYALEEVVWFENQGNDLFSERQVISDSSGHSTCAKATDVDQDGKPDVVVAATDENALRYYRNLGNGVFAPAQVLSSLTKPTGVKPMDLNSDGIEDLVTFYYRPSSNFSQMRYHINQGNGTFGPSLLLYSFPGAGAVDAYARDMDGDLDLDVVFIRSFGNNGTQWVENTGAGYGTVHSVPHPGVTYDLFLSLQPEDIDQDGDVDLVYCKRAQYSWINNIYLYYQLNNGSGTFAAPVQLFLGTNSLPIFDLEIADLDKDNDLDLVWFSSEGVYWGENNGSLNFIKNTIDSVDLGVLLGDAHHSFDVMHLVDFDGDTDLDLLALDNYIRSPTQGIRLFKNGTVTCSISAEAIANGSQTICEGSSTTITATGGSSYSWNQGLGSGATQTVSPTQTTTFEVTVTDTNNCVAVDSITIYVLPKPNISAGNSVAICDGSSATLAASGGTSYVWNQGLGSGSTKVVSPIATTTYQVTGTGSNGCTSTDSVTVTVNALPNANAGNNTAICNGSSTTLTASGGTTYAWNQGLGAGASHTVSPTVTTTYQVTVTDANGCSANDDVTVTVNALPNANAGNNTAICNGSSTTLTASGGTTYAWNQGLGAGASHTVSPTVTTTFQVTVTDANGCSANDDVTVTVNDTYVTNDSAAICQGEMYVFGGQTLTAAGTYTETFSSINSCDSTVVLDLTVNQVNVAVNNNGNSLTASASNASYQWLDCNNGFALVSGATSQTFSPGSSGDYAVIVTEGSCSDTSACTNVTLIGIEQDQWAADVKVYPNPSAGRFNIDLGIPIQNARYEVRDLRGKLILHGDNGQEQKFSIDLQAAAGFYVLLIHTNSATTSHQLKLTK